MSLIKLDQIEQITKADVGLSNVDNTSDLNKPVSTATQSAINLKADTTALTSGLALKQDLSQKDIANGYAGIDGSGKINPNLMPAIAITDTFVVASQAAQIALTVEAGDVAVRTDINKSYILRVAPATTFSNWQELLSPTDQVASVFGRQGTVTAQNGDYNTSQVTESGNLYFTASRVLSTILTGLSLATNQVISATDTLLQALGYLQAQITFNKVKRTSVQLLDVTANHTVSTSIGGDYRVSNRAITIVGVGAYVDTAGVTGLATIDIKVGGVSIMTTNKITIDTAEKTSETAVTAPVLTTTNVTADSIFTFDITGIQTTPAKGLKVWINYNYQ